MYFSIIYFLLIIIVVIGTSNSNLIDSYEFVFATKGTIKATKNSNKIRTIDPMTRFYDTNM